MNQIQEPGKRVVSKTEYVRAMVILTRMRLEIAGALCMNVLFAVVAFWMLYLFINPLTHRKVDGIAFCMFAMCGGLSYSMYHAIIQITKQVKDREIVVPLTRTNTADLPAPR